MPEIVIGDRRIRLAESETVLEGLLRSGVKIPNSCRAGVCQSCLLRAIRGTPPPESQSGLKETHRARGMFLSCAARPGEDLEVDLDAQEFIDAEIVALRKLTPSVLQVLIRPARALEHRAGQYLTLAREDGLARSYSIASLPDKPELELHVRRTPHGRMSGWLFEACVPGQLVKIRGPAGDCFYVPGRPEQPLLLAGTGTGLAPLTGVLRDALANGHTGPVLLYHGALNPDGLYMGDQLTSIAATHVQLQYRPVVRDGGEMYGLRTGELADVIIREVRKLTGWRGYICGNPEIVAVLRKRFFLAGMASKEIFADPFLEAPRTT